MLANSIIEQPNHTYRHETMPALVTQSLAFMDEAFSPHFAHNQKYPNAKLFLDPHPVHMQRNTLSFMLSWGEKNRIPSLTIECLNDLFPKLPKTDKPVNLITLDAEGVAGRITADKAKGVGKIALVTGTQNEQVVVHTYDMNTEFSAQEMLVDMLSNIQAGRPLVFKQAIRYCRFNGYIGLEFDPADESRVLRQLV